MSQSYYIIAPSSLRPNLEPPHPPEPRRPLRNPNLLEPELKTRGINCKQPRLGGSLATQDQEKKIKLLYRILLMSCGGKNQY